MSHDKEPQSSATAFISIRINAYLKKLIEEAAEREGLQVASFIIMVLVRAHILPSSCMKIIKRRPVPFFTELHQLMGTINKVGGNCKQMADALPHTAGLRSTHACINRAAEAVTDALQGKPIPAKINLSKFEGELTDEGYAFNDIVRSVNMGKPQLSGLRTILASISDTTDAITMALTSEPLAQDNDEPKLATDEIRATMKKSAKAYTKRQKGDA
ncbi:MAG: hypothetical protein WCD70_00665 [Alphaproteobacteria bacterium]